jgi:hypothetical protein
MIRFSADYTAPALAGTLAYDRSEHSFSFTVLSPAELTDRVGDRGLTSLLINTLQIEIGVASAICLFVWGYHPQAPWKRGTLSHPTAARPGVIRASADEAWQAGVSESISYTADWITTYDRHTSWICVGNPSFRASGEYIEFATNSIVHLSNSLLQAIWLRPQMK